jgi:hypothetical protein
MRRAGAIALLLGLLATVVAGCGGGSTSALTSPSRSELARAAGFTRDGAHGWRWHKCHITRVFASDGEILAAQRAEHRRAGPDGHYPGGFIVTGPTRLFAVELAHGAIACQEEVETHLQNLRGKVKFEGTPTTVADARAAIEELGYPIRLDEFAGEKGVLVGRVHGSLGERFPFFLFVNRSAPRRMPGVPDYPGFLGEAPHHHGLAGGGLVDGYIFGSREVPVKGESKAQFRQQSNIEIEVEEALCNQATGEDCGI